MVHMQCAQCYFCCVFKAMSSFGPLFYSAYVDLVGSSIECGNSSSEEGSEFIQTQNAIALSLQEKM